MGYFTGLFERTVDAKNRIQLPSQVRAEIDPERDGKSLYVTPGEFSRTLSIFTTRGFEALAARIETEFIPGPESRRFELQFYSLASRVDLDGQHRFVLPETLLRMARLEKEVLLVGQKWRIDIWNRADYQRELGIDFEGDQWPDWQGFLRMRPGGNGQAPTG